MENSLLLARLIGPYIILVGIAVLLNIKIFQQIMDDFLKSPALTYITGLITFSIGLAIVLFHNIWEADWRIIITLFGWMALIKGAWLVILPQTLSKTAKIFLKNTKLLVIPWSIMILIGILLSFKGYTK